MSERALNFYRTYTSKEHPSHNFDCVVDECHTAEFQNIMAGEAGAIHTWQIVRYADATTYKVRNATTASHRMITGWQAEYRDLAEAQRATEEFLRKFGSYAVSQWTPIKSTIRKVA